MTNGDGYYWFRPADPVPVDLFLHEGNTHLILVEGDYAFFFGCVECVNVADLSGAFLGPFHEPEL